MHEGPFAQLHDYFELDDTDSLYDEYWKEAREHLEEGKAWTIIIGKNKFSTERPIIFVYDTLTCLNDKVCHT